MRFDEGTEVERPPPTLLWGGAPHKERFAIKRLNEVSKVIKGSKVLIMGLTYKENMPDTRESAVMEMVKELKEFGVDVYGHDPLLSKEEIEDFDIKALDFLLAPVFFLH